MNIDDSNNLRSASGQRGFAIFITLGILTMLLLMALTFATTARVSRKAAANSNDVTVARLLAESGIQRAIGAMRFYSTISSVYDNIYSHDETDPIAANRKTHDWIHKINTVFDEVEYTLPTPYNADASDAVHWQYVYNGLSGADNRIIGRIAFVTATDVGKLDPSSCVDHNPTGTAVNENGANEKRPGRDVKEINLANLDPTYALGAVTAARVSNMSSTRASPAGLLEDSSRWADFSTIFSRLGITDLTQKEYFRSWFVLDNPPDPEAFWEDSNSNGMQDPGEMYHRFDLTRSDWDSLTVPGIMSSPSVWSNSSSTNNGTGIPWIKNWTDAGTFTDAATRGKQVAANLIDYCDSNDDVTTDNTTDPTYTGNEKTPYINEVGIQVKCNVMMVNIPGPWKRCDMDFYVRGGAELVNIYRDTGISYENFNAATSINIQGNIEFEYRAENPAGTYNYSGTFDMTFSLTPVGTSQYVHSWDMSAYILNKIMIQVYCEPPHKVFVENVKISLNKAILTYNGKFADCAKPNSAGEWSPTLATLVDRSSNGYSLTYYSYQADDPRQNLNPGDWNETASGVILRKGKVANKFDDSEDISAQYATIGTPNAINAAVNCTTYGDTEAGSTPGSISTAFIRNAPMQSPWELGFIHRGGIWESLNIDTYNDSAGVTSAGGGGAYANGDANILDQIKMTPNVETYGKVNVNSTKSRVLQALLANIYAGVRMWNSGADNSYGNSDDNDPAQTAGYGAGTVLDYNTDVINMATAIAGSAGKPFMTRGQIAKVATLKDGTEITQDTDAKKEEIIGKIVNLTKASSLNDDNINIIVLAQAIKDVGGGVSLRLDLDQNGSIGTASELSSEFDIDGDGDASDTGISETISNCQYGVYDKYADEILSEQKVLAVVNRNPLTGKWRIVKMFYLEE